MIVNERRPIGRLSFPCLDPAYWPKSQGMVSNVPCPKAGEAEIGDLGISLIPDAIQDNLDKLSSSIGQLPVALVSIGIGGLVVFGSAVLPSDPAWLKYVKIGGIAVGIYFGYIGATQAMAKVSAKPPKAGTEEAAVKLPDLDIKAIPGWKWLGTPRLDLNIYNKALEPRTLLVRAKNYFGGDPATRSLVFGWNDEEIEVPANGGATRPFYLSEEHVKKVPGERSALFEIFDKKTGQHVVNYEVRFSF